MNHDTVIVTDQEQYNQPVSIIVRQSPNEPYYQEAIKSEPSENDQVEPDLLYTGLAPSPIVKRLTSLFSDYGRYIMPQFDDSRSYSAVY